MSGGWDGEDWEDEKEEEDMADIDYGSMDAYAEKEGPASLGGIEAFLQDGGMGEMQELDEGQRMRDELLPTKAAAGIDLDEKLTDMQRKDGINRLKILALMALTYHHTTTGEGMAAVFNRDVPAERDIRLHLKEDE